MPLPEGRITMLFTDIEGSTELLRSLGSRYGEVLTAQRAIIRAAISARNGHEMGTEGDSFFVVFATAGDGVAAAVDAQRALTAHDWPDGAGVRIRMGLHVGTPERHEEGYLGIDLNTAARVASTANGGQVVISAELKDEVATARPDLAFRDLGLHRLKDLAEPKHLFHVVIPGVPDVLTPIRSLGAPTNLPAERAPLLGRAAELALVVERLEAGDRLLTLTGPGGAGKTSLALAVARGAVGAFVDGVYFVGLEEARTAEAAWAVLAAALGQPATDSVEEAAVTALGPRRTLLVLDNLEQLGEAAQVVSTLLDRTRAVLVATSRGPLRVRAERELPVRPLALADAATPAAVLASPAAQLFVREAQRIRPSFAVDADTAPIVRSICAKLEGLPLALELAAARIRLLGLAALDDSLSRQLSLSAREGDRPDRQRTLAATIAWSYDLLDDEGRGALGRLGVFAGGASLEAAAAVLQTDSVDDLITVLDGLTDVGLVSLEEDLDGGMRVTLLSSVRQYVGERLDASGAGDDVRRLHAQHFVELAETASAALKGPHQLVWSDRLSTEHDNFRAAFEWASETPDQRILALRLATALGWFWYTHGRGSEGRSWLERAVDADDGSDAVAQAKALHALGVLAQQQGDNDRAADCFARSLDHWRDTGDLVAVAKCLNSLGVTRWAQGRPVEARELLEQSVATARESGDESRAAAALSNLGVVALSTGAPEEAITSLQEALEIDRRLGDPWGIAVDQSNLGAALVRVGEPLRAHEVLVEALRQGVDLDDPDLIASTVEACACAAGSAGDPRRCAVLVGGADALRAEAGIPRTAPEEEFLERERGPARHALGAESYEQAWETGSHLSRADLVATASAPL